MRLKLLTVAALAASLATPAAADAAKLKISGGSIHVDDDAVAPIKVTNAGRSTARGTLTLKAGRVRVGSSRFSIPARRTKKVLVAVKTDDALNVLATGGVLNVVASAKATRLGSASKNLRLSWPGAATVGGEQPQTGTPTVPGGTTTPPAPPPPPPPGGIPDGTTFAGTTEQGETFKFTKVAGDMIKPQSFHIHANCIDSRDASSTNQTGSLILPGEFPLAADGTFTGSGTKDGIGSLGTASMRYTFSGRIVGNTAQGTFSVHWENLGFSSYPVVTTWQIFCGGEVPWTAARQ